MNTNRSRGRAAAAALTGLALLGGGAVSAAVTSSPATAVPPVEDCAVPFPAADVAAGDQVTGLTVVSGTTPTAFGGEILGVINDGIAPGLPMIMARLDSVEINRVGIWQGMSGSPVYADDGRLIGAVAYGLAYGPSPVAGITPFEDMDEYLGDTVTAVPVGPRAAQRIAAATDVSASQAAQGFEQLPMPLSFSGLSQRRLDQLQGKRGPDFVKTRGATAMGAASGSVDAGEGDLVAGGNLGAAISYGDITAGGVGTVTSVCDGELVGFGHPLGFFGRTTLGLMPAEAVYIQEDPVGPGFKVANMGDPVGTIDQDRLTGISGPLGVLPEQTAISSTLTYGAKERVGESWSMVDAYDADVTFSQLLANHDRVVDAWQGGSESSTFSIQGTDAEGNPFEVAWSERYVSDADIAYESSWELAETVWLLNRMKDVTVDSVTATGTVSDATAKWRLTGVQQRVGGQWVGVGRKQPVVVRPGGTLHLRAQLTDGERGRNVPLSVAVPSRTTRNGYLEVVGGSSAWDSPVYDADTPAEMVEAIASTVANDQVQVTLQFFKRGKDVVRMSSSPAQSLVVAGRTWAEVEVRR